MILLHSTFLAIVLVQSSDWNERQWSDHLAQQLGGTSEVRLADDSRCDILTDDYVYEVEWADKWKEAPSQAILYGGLTNRKPAVILLLKQGQDNKRSILRCALVCAKVGVRFETRKVP